MVEFEAGVPPAERFESVSSTRLRLVFGLTRKCNAESITNVYRNPALAHLIITINTACYYSQRAHGMITTDLHSSDIQDKLVSDFVCQSRDVAVASGIESSFQSSSPTTTLTLGTRQVLALINPVARSLLL